MYDKHLKPPAGIRVFPSTRLANSSRGLDLCTKGGKRGSRGAPLCYKTGSARKSMIFKEFFPCTFFGRSSQALDFSGRTGMREGDFNKVIHTVGVLCANDFQIKDLAVLYKAQRKVARWRD